VVEGSTGTVLGVINNLRGNITLVYDSRDQEFSWLPEILSSYGQLTSEAMLDRAEASEVGDLAATLIASSVWQGRRLDATGLINFGARYYDPLTKRFLSCDPLGHQSTPDLYVYADSDPVNNIDDDGRFRSAVYEDIEHFTEQCKFCFRHALLPDPIFQTSAALTVSSVPFPKSWARKLGILDRGTGSTTLYSIIGHKISKSKSIPANIKSILKTDSSLLVGKLRTTNILRYIGRIASPATATFTSAYSAGRMFRCITEEWDNPGE
jgi:RHS repeat-associated protein